MDSSIVSLTTPKLWRQAENIICGYAGSGGVGQMIQYMNWPVLDKENMSFMDEDAPRPIHRV